MNGLIGEAEQVKITAGSTIVKGQVTETTNIVSAAYTDAANGQEYIAITKHSRMVGDKADSAEVIAQNDIAYWKASTGGLTKTSSGNRKIGWFKEASAAGATQAVISFDGTLVVG